MEFHAALTIGQLANVLGVHTWTIRILERRGRFPAPRRGKVSGERYYPVADVRKLRALLEGTREFDRFREASREVA